MLTKDTQIKNINIHFWILLNFALCAIFNDYIVYITEVNYGISLIISTIILIISNFFLIKKKKLITLKSDFEWYDLIFILLLITLIIARIAIPDYIYDTVNYHIYLQENIKIDKINFDFFAGKTINGFLFPLGDRMFYITRYLLGYRLGTILSYYSILVIFYQFKNILNNITGKRKLNSLISILCWSSVILKQLTGYYYIDNFLVVFLLSIINFIFIEKDCFSSKCKLFYLSILTGILIGIKLPNIFLIIPIFIIAIIQRRKQFTVKNLTTYGICIIIFIIPFILYIIDNLIQTGSPLYPYYNNIFKSEYFGNYSWVEPRFGIPNWKYKLIWPIYTSLANDGYGDDWFVQDPIWAVGYIINIIYLIYGIINFKKVDKKTYYFSLISLILTFMWIQFLYGYMRYGLIIPILYSITIGCLCCKLAYYIRKKYFLEFKLKFIHIILIFFSVNFVICNIGVYTKDISNKNIIDNYSLIFKDRNGIKIHLENDGVWGVIGDDSGLTSIVREKNVPIYNLQKDLFDSSEKTKQQYIEILNTHPNIYILGYGSTCNEKLEKLHQVGLTMELVREYNADEIPYIHKPYKLYLFKIKKYNLF